ncbi:MAG: polysaccharide deacetylase family protein [Cyanobium sp.]
MIVLAVVVTAGLAIALVPSRLIRALLVPLFPDVIFCGDGRRRELALTFDDGPTASAGLWNPGSVELLAVLEELDLPATFFLIGEHVQRDRSGFVSAAVAAGHSLANHLERDGLTALWPSCALEEQLHRTERTLRRGAAPQDITLRWFRPGGGWFHAGMLRTIRAHGYRLVLGTIWPWDTFHPPLALMRWFVLANAHPGGIVVLHDRPDTLAATLATLRSVVPVLRQRGYRFVSLGDLLQRS